MNLFVHFAEYHCGPWTKKNTVTKDYNQQKEGLQAGLSKFNRTIALFIDVTWLSVCSVVVYIVGLSLKETQLKIIHKQAYRSLSDPLCILWPFCVVVRIYTFRRALLWILVSEKIIVKKLEGTKKWFPKKYIKAYPDLRALQGAPFCCRYTFF